MVKPESACMPRLSRAVKMQTSSMTQRIAGEDVLQTLGLASDVPGFNFITPVELAMASTPDKASTTPTKPFQFLAKPPVNGCKLCTAAPRCGRQKIPNSSTTTAVGTETKNARPPRCPGPKNLTKPMITIPPAAYISGCGKLK